MRQDQVIEEERRALPEARIAARIRPAGGGRRAIVAMEPGVIEVWEGGRFVGYERTRPERVWLPGIR